MAQSSIIILCISVAAAFTVFLLLLLSTTDHRSHTTTNVARRGLENLPHAPAKRFSHVCGSDKAAGLAFCDRSLPYDVRAEDLVARMTLEEKTQQLGDNARGVTRLGLPPYEWWSEALHGVSNVGPGVFFDGVVPSATSFPTVIVTAASFNATLWKAIGQAVSTEARAMYNLGRAGLTFWSPTMNVARDPRWGRTMETPGEDPFVVGTYAATYVRGLQDVISECGEVEKSGKGSDSRPLKVAACCKHYAAYDMDHWHGKSRYRFDARVREQDMVETFVRPFEMCVKDGDVSSVMCSYNRVNGIPTCADPKLLNETIRGRWKLNGYIVSDCDAVKNIVEHHKYLNDTPEDAIAQTLKAGLNLDCGNYFPKYVGQAVHQGKVGANLIDASLKSLYVVLMRLGYFDGSPEYSHLGKQHICTPENTQLAAEAARQGIVLLRNDQHTLPLAAGKTKTLAVVGPHANATLAMIGNYAFDPNRPGFPCRYVSPVSGLSSYAKVRYSPGCAGVRCPDKTMIAHARKTARATDATVIVAGIDVSVETEGLDRNDLLLPGYQTELISQIARVSKGPVILVIMCAGGVDVSFAKNDPNIKAILWAGYPGEGGGTAIADVIFGRYNPGGRLPLTWYPANYVEKLPMTSMPLRPTGRFPGRTYKFYDGPSVYPFGFGLSYTSFLYNLTKPKNSIIDMKMKKNRVAAAGCHDVTYADGRSQKPRCPGALVKNLECKEKLKFEVAVKNVGDRDGSEAVLVYSRPPEGIAGAHSKQVIGFRRVFVRAGGSKKVKFAVNGCDGLGIVDEAAYKVLPSGTHTIVVGDSGGVTFPAQVAFH
ncbi:unnamed protein product [Linum tenue]|uniref:Fibronectin type III-like domain-containing protein n=1 Tax=Linum tenue TaxID=586396 RepID=A0AAV0N103_9ROSI|nr:unnamed protein product [Linum tenue]